MAWGVIFIMCLNSMSLHFDENRTLATQIGTLGTSVGQFAFPVIITPLVAAYSLKVWMSHLILLPGIHEPSITVEIDRF